MSNQTELLREAVEKLRGMVDANAAKWDMPHDEFCTEYMAWSKNRARAFLAKIDAAKSAVPEGFTLVENRALSQARMALAHATTTHGELYRDAYELLAASGRQDGAR